MKPGNAGALHSGLTSFSEYGEFHISLGGTDVVINHYQFAEYPIERAVRSVYSNLSFDVSDYDGIGELVKDDVDVRSDLTSGVEEAQGLTVDLHSRSHFNNRSYIVPRDLGSAYTKIVSNFGDEEESRYFDGFEWFDSNADFVAKLFSLYNLRIGEQKIFRLKTGGDLETDISQSRACHFLFAVRDVVEKEHGWCTFDEPDPSRETIRKIWAILEEFDEIEPDIELIYGLFVVPDSATRYREISAQGREIQNALGKIGDAVLGLGSDRDKYFSESTPQEVREKHMESN